MRLCCGSEIFARRSKWRATASYFAKFHALIDTTI
jgi:hypothetical protein